MSSLSLAQSQLTKPYCDSPSSLADRSQEVEGYSRTAILLPLSTDHGLETWSLEGCCWALGMPWWVWRLAF
jgi:hypothetical protein